MNENDKWTRYKCDNPNCTSLFGGGFFTKDEGSCPYCGSKEYHSFDANPKYLKRVIDDIINKDF
jgi:hypothetical protein